MHALIIRHLDSEAKEHRFQVQRLSDGKQAEATLIIAPEDVQVAGRPESNLSRELRWYLEKFLNYPFPPETEHAERVRKALEDWGEQAFKGLFESGRGRGFYHDTYRAGLENLTLKIASDDPHILAWPWEALRDPKMGGTLAHHCRIERLLSGQHDPLDLPGNLPRDRINILLITARPYKGDVGFRSLSRSLLELIKAENLPAQIEMLRPPSFDQLRQTLHKRPGYYHIVHFDGHGGYGPSAQPDSYQLCGHQGQLTFETDEGEEDPITAEDLSTLLREHRIPIVVLNACQSAMIDAQAEDAFASVAAALQRGGVRSVVAMAYSLYVSGAQVFLPDFYRRLFEQGSIAEAVRAGRQAMLRHKGRICYRGEFPLEDWLVPVVYQQDPPVLNFAKRAAVAAPRETVALPPEITEDTDPYGCIGRDNALLALERALRRPPAGILLHGLAGIGKTTLAKGFVKSLADTGGLGNGCFWFTFNNIHSSEFVINQMVATLFGTHATVADKDQKLVVLVKLLKEQPFIIVWDNFESVSGVPGTEVQPLLPEQDRVLLRDFLYKLRGGKTKVLITSRSLETAWLNRPNCYRLPLGGLQGEERWTYCHAIVRDLGLTVNRNDPEFSRLMDLLNGHPLMMRVMLTQLVDHTAAALSDQLRHRLNRAPAATADNEQAKLFATLQFVQDALPESLQPLLAPLALHERFVDAALLESMTRMAHAPQIPTDIDRLLKCLEAAGLLHHHGHGLYALHPSLTAFLRARTHSNDPTDEVWRRAFAKVMQLLTEVYPSSRELHVPDDLHTQQFLLYLHGTNLHTALSEAKRLGMEDYWADLLQTLANYAQNQRDLVTARRYSEGLAKHWKQKKDQKGEAVAYFKLGVIADIERDFAQAEWWFRKALSIEEALGDEHGAAKSYT